MRNPVDPNELVEVELEPSEHSLLWQGLHQWGGPARCTEEMAVALGFEGIDHMSREGKRLRALLDGGKALTRLDWLRVLLCTEVVFSSAVLGAGHDWVIISGMSDAESLATLRSVQRKLGKHVRVLVGRGFGTRPPSQRPRARD